MRWACLSFLRLPFEYLLFLLRRVDLLSPCVFRFGRFSTSLSTSPKPCLSVLFMICHFSLFYTDCSWVICLPWVNLVTMFLARFPISLWLVVSYAARKLLYLFCVSTRIWLTLWEIYEITMSCYVISSFPFLLPQWSLCRCAHCPATHFWRISARISLAFDCYLPTYQKSPGRPTFVRSPKSCVHYYLPAKVFPLLASLLIRRCIPCATVSIGSYIPVTAFKKLPPTPLSQRARMELIRG